MKSQRARAEAAMSHRNFRHLPGSICAPRGFRAAAVFCDIKSLGTGKGSEKGRKKDLAVIASDVPAAVAGMFTTNQVSAPPVKWSATRASQNFARAIVVNSGNANACTGKQGIRDAKTMCELTAQHLATFYQRQGSHESTGRALKKNVGSRDVLVCSTGRIGIPMPIKKIGGGIEQCVPLLTRSQWTASDTAEAIMTSDTRRKAIAIETRIDGVRVRLGGIAKGAGMIQPRMRTAGDLRRVYAGGTSAHALHATMLAFITSDVAIAPALLKTALEKAVDVSFNRITIDGDTSTNDSVIALANGLAGNRRIERRDSRFAIFEEALTFVCLHLAKMIVQDGEGVSRFVAVYVHHAKTAGDAEAAARSVANSPLVKTSWCGGDPNWGRILCALGYANARIEESHVDIGYRRMDKGRIAWGFRGGRPARTSWSALTKITSAPQFEVHVDLHLGRHDFVLYASDLTESYVAFNKGNIGDPDSLGG